MIERKFHSIPEGKVEESNEYSSLPEFGYSSKTNWATLLESKRILIVSEAGSGKTYECRSECDRLWEAGEPSFFLELAALSSSDIRSMLSEEEETRFDHWFHAQSGLATFFLDSFDELKLSLGSFEQALKRLAKAITGSLDRARIVITTRPIPFDQEVVQRVLPVPPPAIEFEANGEAFARIALKGVPEEKSTEKSFKQPPEWIHVALLPLDDEQIVEFAQSQGVDNPNEMLEDLKRRNAEDFARRPQDLIELSVDWRDHKRIRSHKDQVEGNIRIKSKPREDRAEHSELSVTKAIEGASRLALAMVVTRRLTIRHSAESDQGGAEAAFDPNLILSDWTAAERKTLLERPLFGFASYGRVRFHHRSVIEFLASERVRSLRVDTMSTSALKRLIFVQTRGKTIVRHSRRPIAGWLALSEPTVFEIIRDNEPDVLFNEGDPESLTIQQRLQVLRAFVHRHSKGDWRGIRVPNIQISRFASPDLAEEINFLWSESIENREIREILLQLIELGQIEECSDIAFTCALDPQLDDNERLAAIDALVSIKDERLSEVVNQITYSSQGWSDRLILRASSRLFPKHMTITQLMDVFPKLKLDAEQLEDLSWYLPHVISNTSWDPRDLEALRDGFSKLIDDDLHWEEEWPHYFSNQSHLSRFLAVTCIKGIKSEVTAEWMRSSLVCLLFSNHDTTGSDTIEELSKLLNELPILHRQKLFWKADELLQSLNPIEDSWKRFWEITNLLNITIERNRDFEWIKECLSDPKRSESERAVILEAASRLAPSAEDWLVHMDQIRHLVEDNAALIRSIDERIARYKENSSPAEWEIKQAERKDKFAKKEAKQLADWSSFWREISENPEKLFSEDRERNTAWNLWKAMTKAGSRGRESGWNRRFIEDYFGKDIAERLRLTLMRQWRHDRPTLASERPEDAKGTYLIWWQVGLAGIYAESEDPAWATKLSGDEARLAARYATIELNSLPVWVGSLVEKYPVEVEETLGSELVEDLNCNVEKSFHSMLMQNIGYSSPEVIEIFIPRIKAWLETKTSNLPTSGNFSGEMERLVQVTRFLAKHGDSTLESYLSALAKEKVEANLNDPFFEVWIQLLMRYDAKTGVEALEHRVQSVIPSKRSEAVHLFGSIFGDRHGSISLADQQFTPPILLRLMRLAYRHIRRTDDAHHAGAYTPDSRDEAESVRNGIVNALLASKGDEGWAAKIEMAEDPNCAHFKDRILAMARESWAEEIDSDAFNDTQAVALDKSGEAAPTTNEAMFAMMVDRLEDIDDLLLRDISPRESWAKDSKERIMRRNIARELTLLAKGLYSVDQEAVTADEKETDIRLRSTASSHEAIIELKIADGRSATNLLSTFDDQLVKKYMASEVSRSGCLLIALCTEKTWDNPFGGSRIDFEELVELLRNKADRLVQESGGIFQLHVHAFNLNPRLPTEAHKAN